MEKIKQPTFTTSNNFVGNDNYKDWLNDIKQRLKSSQAKAAFKVNSLLLEFYWSLGRDLVAMKAEQQWGSGVVEQLSLDLKDAFPNQKGFSASSIWGAKRWYLFYIEYFKKLQQPVEEFGDIEMPEKFGLVPWGHHLFIIEKCKTVEEAFFYIDKTIEGNWSRHYLTDMVKANLYERKGKAISNFESSLPSPHGSLVQEVLKDPYNFDFLTLNENYREKDLEEALAHNITRFLLELGTGFAFVGRQVELRMPGGQTFYPDMIFYHTKLKCYVVVELKVVDFIPEFAGKLNFYVSAADHLLKDENDNPSIGLLICKAKDETVVKWSFQDINKPIGVASYELQTIVNQTLLNGLPASEDIERIISE